MTSTSSGRPRPGKGKRMIAQLALRGYLALPLPLRRAVPDSLRLRVRNEVLPVIATAVGGNPSLVDHEVSGLLVPECRPELLARAMTSLAMAHDRRQDMGRMGRSRIEREFSLQAMVHSFDQTYQLLLQDAGMRACAVMP